MSSKPSPIENHRNLQTELLSFLDTLKELTTELNQGQEVKAIEEMKLRLHGDVFNVAVVGEFKRGKSTLINALLGKEILPADVLPCSATLNRVTYGLKPKVELKFKPKEPNAPAEIETINIDELSQYVTKLTPESEKNAADIEEAVIYYPTKYCRDKADLIDTPGLNDDAAMTNVTLKVLPEVDACILVILAQSPFSAYEAEFLSQLLTKDLGRVIFVVNRIDEIRRAKDRERVVDLVRSRIKKCITKRISEIHPEGSEGYINTLKDIGEPRIFPVSGGLALDAKLEHDIDLLNESAFPTFEKALEEFLTVERGLISLITTVNFIFSTAADIERQIKITLGSLGMEAKDFEALLTKTQDQLQELEQRLQTHIRGYDTSRVELIELLNDTINNSRSILLQDIEQTIDQCELTASDISDNKDEVFASIEKSVRHQFKINTEKLVYQLDELIKKAIGKDLSDFEQISEEAYHTLQSIQHSFTTDSSSAEDELLAGGLLLVTRFNPISLLATGAISGYKVAGLKGAAVGSISGAAAGVGTLFTSAMVLATFAVPITLPIQICVLAATGFGSWFGGKWTTSYFLGDNIVQDFKDECKSNIIMSLQNSIPEYITNLREGLHAHIDTQYENLKLGIENNLGNSIRQTSQALQSLQEQRLSKGVEREHMVQKCNKALDSLNQIQEKTKTIQDAIHSLSTQEQHS